MTEERDQIRAFRQQYLDYVEGLSPTPPSLDQLTEDERKRVEGWLVSLGAARGVDPFASRPSTADLLSRAADARDTDLAADIEQTLRAGLHQSVDSEAVVVPDAASIAAGLSSRLVIHARGMRLRVIIDSTGTDIDATYAHRVADIAAVFGAFPDTNAVLIATPEPSAKGVVVDRDDVVTAIETPSGRSRPPRIRRPISDPTTACRQFVTEAIPIFEPFEYTALTPAGTASAAVDTKRLAQAAIDGVVASGKRARVDAKRAAWCGLGVHETAALSALLADALEGVFDKDGYRRRLADIGDAA